jgi:hypothetical protein
LRGGKDKEMNGGKKAWGEKKVRSEKVKSGKRSRKIAESSKQKGVSRRQTFDRQSPW